MNGLRVLYECIITDLKDCGRNGSVANDPPPTNGGPYTATLPIKVQYQPHTQYADYMRGQHYVSQPSNDSSGAHLSSPVTAEVLVSHEHREQVSGKALKLLALLQTMVETNNVNCYSDYCSEVSNLTSTKLHVPVCVYLVTRCPKLLDYLNSAAHVAYTRIKEMVTLIAKQDNQHQSRSTAYLQTQLSASRKTFNAVWLFVARLLSNMYSLDVRIIVCEKISLVNIFLKAALDPKIYLDTATPNTIPHSSLLTLPPPQSKSSTSTRVPTDGSDEEDNLTNNTLDDTLLTQQTTSSTIPQTSPHLTATPAPGQRSAQPSATTTKLFKVLDAFGLSTFWITLLENDMGKSVLAAVKSGIDKNISLYQADPTRALIPIMESLRLVVLLTIVCEDFCALISKDQALTNRILKLVLLVSDFSDLEWAILNVMWLAEMKVVGFPSMAAQLGPGNSTTDPIQLSLPVLVSGHCLTLLHVMGRNPVGASGMAASGGKTLKAIKKLVNIHSEVLLKKTGLWPMVVALIPTCSLGVTTSCNDPSLVSIRRLKHYNILLPCTCCSKVAIGSRQLKICGECHLIRYCGRQCQQTDWQDGHNTLCRHFVSPAMK
eukprot:Blabericola_migrator_1__4948@NODE_257_length_10777_cov_171_650047_g215_i0_p2_GENE_NODE_257_length_10777_cov_171_650047_g215_i0NODE_257_length_10777_cov_171_650047_g215_i0_p2_ORF_typecomplete_len601_score68_82zfMYND/PF01753_18/1_3e04zfMYND/PF01753_18/8_1e08_NODE_257_length_10777_cov_171_650047_g215_i054747276